VSVVVNNILMFLRTGADSWSTWAALTYVLHQMQLATAVDQWMRIRVILLAMSQLLWLRPLVWCINSILSHTT